MECVAAGTVVLAGWLDAEMGFQSQVSIAAPYPGPPMALSGGRSTPRGRARRQDLIEAALQAFAADGYRGASVAAIAKQCGLSEPGLLHHFPSKTALLMATLETYERKA